MSCEKFRVQTSVNISEGVYNNVGSARVKKTISTMLSLL